MADAVIAALITGAITLVGVVINSLSQQNKISREFEKQNSIFQSHSELEDKRLESQIQKLQAVTDTKLDELTREVRTHNNFAQRIPVLEEKIISSEHRLDLLEGRL